MQIDKDIWKLSTGLVALAIATAAHGEPPAFVGTWVVEIKGSPRPRALVITQEGDAIRAKFGFIEPGARLGPISVTLEENGSLTLNTKADSTVVLKPSDVNSMVGMFTPHDGKSVRATAARSTPEALSSQLAGGGMVAAMAERAPVQTSAAPLAALPVAAAAPDAVVHFIWMGGNDCPPCKHWRATELPRLQQMPEFQRIRYSYITKTIQSPVPPKMFLPDEVQPLKGILDVAGAGTPGSPQAALVVNGQVHDYFWGVRSAQEIEAMIKSIRTGSKYPFARCVKMAAESRKCGVYG